MPFAYRPILHQWLTDYGADTSHDGIRTLINTLRSPEDAYASASALEGVGVATIRALLRAYDAFLDPWWCLARPFDDGDARLCIITSSHVIHNAVWSTYGSLREWGAIAQAVWADGERFLHVSAQPPSRSA